MSKEQKTDVTTSQEKLFLLPEGLLNKLANYLATKPYGEVVQSGLMNELSVLKEAKISNKPKKEEVKK